MKYLFVSLIYFIGITPCVAQNEGNTWIFGDSAGINFVNGVPIPIVGTNIYSIEATATIVIIMEIYYFMQDLIYHPVIILFL
jgi:hypothetical protein